jgi:hypothetical protein
MKIDDLLSSSRIDNQNKIAVYTAVTSSYDKINKPIFIDKNIDYYLFTDNVNSKENIWNISNIKFKYRDPRRLAKLFKVFPHLLFPNYEYSIWLDANFKITGDLSSLVNNNMKNSYLGFVKHPKRLCIYDESDYILSLGYDNNQKVENQIKKYLKNGYPKNNGLIAGGFIIRRHHNKKCIELMEKWWDEIDSYSSRDQLSFNYVSWRKKYDYHVFNIDMYNNDYFEMKSHPSIKFYDNNGKRIITFKLIKAILLHYISSKKLYKKFLRKYYLLLKSFYTKE